MKRTIDHPLRWATFAPCPEGISKPVGDEKYKHDARTSERVPSVLTRLRFVLVLSVLTRLRFVLVLSVVALTACSAPAQDLGLEGFNFGGESKKHVAIAASYEPGKAAGTGTLVLKATIDKGWHIYSTSQKRGGPAPTKVKLGDSSQYKQAGPISYTPKPEIKEFDFWPGLKVEEHHGSVTWRVPIETAVDGAKPSKIHGVVVLQMCDPNRCIPAKIEFRVSDR